MKLSDVIKNSMNAAEIAVEERFREARRRESPPPYIDSIPQVREFIGNHKRLTTGLYSPVHKFVNGLVTYTKEAPGEDYWQTPFETLNSRRGDCEDFALAYLAILRLLPHTVMHSSTIDIVRSTDSGEYHAVLVINNQYVLDCKSSNIVALGAHRKVWHSIMRLTDA